MEFKLLIILNKTKCEQERHKVLDIAEFYAGKYDIDEVDYKTYDSVLGLDDWSVYEEDFEDDITIGAPLKQLIEKINVSYEDYDIAGWWLDQIDYWYGEQIGRLKKMPSKEEIEDYYSKYPESNIYVVALNYKLK